MNRPDQHPDTELLDQLRAGLLDDDPQRRSGLEAHLEHCEQCRRRYDWPAALAGGDSQTDQLNERLDRARRRALATPPGSALRRFAPLATAAAIALIAILAVNQWQQTQPTETQVAGTGNGEIPEVYEDLDFYL